MSSFAVLLFIEKLVKDMGLWPDFSLKCRK